MSLTVCCKARIYPDKLFGKALGRLCTFENMKQPQFKNALGSFRCSRPCQICFMLLYSGWFVWNWFSLTLDLGSPSTNIQSSIYFIPISINYIPESVAVRWQKWKNNLHWSNKDVFWIFILTLYLSLSSADTMKRAGK